MVAGVFLACCYMFPIGCSGCSGCKGIASWLLRHCWVIARVFWVGVNVLLYVSGDLGVLLARTLLGGC